ncbi:MAG TPA: TonB-dependent receptor plug domain-containing protein [Minicystis sp.]|nr:TonB-dependent receptor plug domain-containing protein [Minicystis sp.]
MPRKNATEILTLAPGIMLTNEGGEGHAEQVFLRGFDAREGQDLEFTVDGVPINESGNLHGNGYADTHFILPELVTNLCVLEGPFDPRQGNYAVAGSADYELGLEERGLVARTTYGSWNTTRGLVLWGPPGTGTRTFGGAEVYSTDGFGQNRDAKRASAIGQYEGRLGDGGTFRVTAQAFADSYHEAGLVRLDDYRAGRIGFYDTYDPRQGGDDSRYSLAGTINGRAGDVTYMQQLFVIDRGMRLREKLHGLPPRRPDAAPGAARPARRPHRPRHERADDRRPRLRQDHGQGLRAEAGARAWLLRARRSRRRDAISNEAATGAPYHLDTDLESKLGDVALYADLGLRPTSWITFRGGVRADLFAFDVLDKCAVQSVAHPSKEDPPGDASCLSQEDFGAYREPVQRASTATPAVLPRGSILLGPERGFLFAAEVGRGVRSVDPSYVVQDIPTPFASVLSYDGGVTYAGGRGNVTIVAKSIFFQTKVDKDLIFNQTEGRNVLAGPTTRTGWVGSVRLTGTFFDVSANATLVKSTFDQDPSTARRRGSSSRTSPTPSCDSTARSTASCRSLTRWATPSAARSRAASRSSAIARSRTGSGAIRCSRSTSPGR